MLVRADLKIERDITTGHLNQITVNGPVFVKLQESTSQLCMGHQMLYAIKTDGTVLCQDKITGTLSGYRDVSLISGKK